MTERDKIIGKIKKCLALSASSNEHEAAGALRQASKLMEAHGITDLDVLAAEAEERRAKAGAARQPANWEAMLAGKIGDAFCCRVLFMFGWKGGEWCYIGCGAAPEVAQYAFAVLLRQARRARAAYIKARLKRCKTETKTRRADLFSEGWVRGVVSGIIAFAGGEQQATAIEAYVDKHYPSLGNLKARNRNDGRTTLRDHEYNDYVAGGCAGRDAQLNRGVGGMDERKALQ